MLRPVRCRPVPVGRPYDGPRPVERYALLVALVGVIVTFAAPPSTSDSFLTTANLKFVLNNQAVPVLVALAVMLPLIVNEFDLSVGALAGLSSSWPSPPSPGSASAGRPAILLAVAGGRRHRPLQRLARRPSRHQFAGRHPRRVERHHRTAHLVHGRRERAGRPTPRLPAPRVPGRGPSSCSPSLPRRSGTCSSRPRSAAAPTPSARTGRRPGSSGST